MKTVKINIEKEIVIIDNEMNTFEEAGLKPNGVAVTDEDTIEEHLSERIGEEIELEFL